jgi:MFS family permease
MTLFSISFSLALGGALGPVLSPVTGLVAKEFHISISKAALGAGYPLMTAALGALICSVTAPIFGKRSAYLASTLILFTSTLWSGQVTSWNSLLGARTFQGFGNGAYESIVISSIGDLYFVRKALPSLLHL